MFKALLQESFGNLGGSVAPEAQDQPEEFGVLRTLGMLIGQEVFTGVTENGESYTTIVTSTPEPTQTPVRSLPASRPSSQPTEITKPTAAKNGLAKPGQPSAPEKAVSAAGDILGTIATNIFAGLAMPLDALAIKANLVPTPEEMFGKPFHEFTTAAKAYHAIPQIIESDPTRYQAIRDAAQMAVSLAIPLPDHDVTWDNPTSHENQLASNQAYAIARAAVEKLEDGKCPYCRHLPCSCGATNLTSTFDEVIHEIEPLAGTHNTEIAMGIAQAAYVQATRKRAAESIKRVVQGTEIEVLHIPPKSLLAGAFLGDWKQVPKALIASILSNESGKRGATITLSPKPQNQGGGSLIVNMAEIGAGTDTDEFPLNALTSWEQSTLQGVLSDNKRFRRKWDRTQHGSTPEIGSLTITNPGDKSVQQQIPVAVRFPKGSKPASGGGGLLSMAISEINNIQSFLKDVTGNGLSGVPLLNSEEDIHHYASQQAIKALESEGLRPGVVARKATVILNKIFDNTAARPTLDRIVNSVVVERQQKRTAEAKQGAAAAELNLALSNLASVQNRRQTITPAPNSQFVTVIKDGREIPYNTWSRWTEEDWAATDVATRTESRDDVEPVINNILDWTSEVILAQGPAVLRSIQAGIYPPGLENIDADTLRRAILTSIARAPKTPKPKQSETPKKKGWFTRKSK